MWLLEIKKELPHEPYGTSRGGECYEIGGFRTILWSANSDSRLCHGCDCRMFSTNMLETACPGSVFGRMP